MSYKGRFHPSQVLLQEGQWIDYRDSKGKVVEIDSGIEFSPKTLLQDDI